MRESSKSDAVLSRDEDEFIDYGAAGTPEPEPSPDQWSHVWASLNGASQSSNLFDEVAGSHLSGRSCSSTWNPADQSASTGRTYGGLGDKSDTSFDVPTTPDSSPASINDPIQDHVGLQIRASSSCSHELSQPLCINPKVLHSPPSLTTDESSKMDPIESSQTLRRAVQPRALAPARPKKMTLSVLKPMRVTKRTVKPKSTRQCDINKEKRKTDKPLRCLSCNEGFAWNRDLVRHREVRHTGGAPRTRVICPYPNCVDQTTGERMTFSRKDHVVRHVKNKHT